MVQTRASRLWWLQRRLWSTVAALIGVAFVGAGVAAADDGCPCPKRTTGVAVAQATVIFIGKVLAVTSDSGPVTMQGGQWRGDPGATGVQRVTMQVDTTLKGRAGKVELISTPDLCGYPLAPGGTYLVFAARNPTGLWTDACKGNASGNMVADRADEVRRVLAGSDDD